MYSVAKNQKQLLSVAKTLDIVKTPRLSCGCSDNLIVIQGAQRSGTTLLYLMLTAHPQLVGLDENEAGYELPPWQVLAINRMFGKKTVYKLPPVIWQLNKFQQFYRNCHILWVTRHPLAVVSSMRSLWFAKEKKNWLQRFGIQELNRAAVFFPELKELDKHALTELEMGAHLWVAKQRMSDVYKSAGFSVTIVRYEDLLSDTESVARDVLRRLSLEWSNKVLEHHYHHGNQMHPGGTKADKPIDPSRAEPKLSFSEQEKMEIKKICQETMYKYGYSIS